MFERYTDTAKRVIFFARYEAAQAGSSAIESEHLLLGILRDGRGLAAGILAKRDVTRERIERVLKSHRRAMHPEASVEIPLSPESKRVLTTAASESVQRQASGVDTEHILMGILREEECLAAVALRKLGVSSDEVGSYLTKLSNDPAWQRRKLVEELGVETAYQDDSIRRQLSDAERIEVEALLARTRTLADAADAAIASKDFNQFAILRAEEMELGDRLHHLLAGDATRDGA